VGLLKYFIRKNSGHILMEQEDFLLQKYEKSPHSNQYEKMKKMVKKNGKKMNQNSKLPTIRN